MPNLTEWWKDLTEEFESTLEYQVESASFNISIQVYNRIKELGLTQKELAEKLGVSKSYVSQILKGKSNMTIETIIKLGTVLDLAPVISLTPKVENYKVMLVHKEKPIFEEINFADYLKSMPNVTGSAESVVSLPLGYDTAGNENIKTVAV